MAMILARAALGIRPARILASSLIPFSVSPPPPPPQSQRSPVPIGPFTAWRLTPPQIRVPYDFSGKGRLGSVETLRRMTTQSSSSDEEKLKKVENFNFALDVMTIICQLVIIGCGAAILWKISDN